MWRLVFFALVWTIWTTRSMVVFHEDNFDEYCFFEMLCFHSLVVESNLGTCSPGSVIDMSISTCGCPFYSATTKIRPNTVQTLPTQGSIKVNIYGSYCAKFNRNDIDGIFRNHKGNVLLQFSKHIHVEYVIHAQLLAVFKGFLIFAVSCWATSTNLFFNPTLKLLLHAYQITQVHHGGFKNRIRKYL